MGKRDVVRVPVPLWATLKRVGLISSPPPFFPFAISL